MKNLLIVALLGLTMSCAAMSEKTRDNALLPGAVLAWDGVRANVERGIADAVEDGELMDSTPIQNLVDQLDAALKSGKRSDLRPIPWESTLKPYAERGIQDMIDDGELHELVAPSLRTRLDNFTFSMTQLVVKQAYWPVRKTKQYWLPNGGGRVTSETAVAIATTH